MPSQARWIPATARLSTNLITSLMASLSTALVASVLLPWGGVPAASAAMVHLAAACRARIKAFDWQGAVQLCSQAIEKDPKLTAAWIDRCQASL
ncbi:hypothetical protein KQ304_09950 [Synechococcus sp. CS-1329]|uniref:hypothetical protein n=1 Tax=Synechococcus sp. CS-1329 TaxID=2847975 RepID=UPI00223B52BE|nr:hypothetical protein [Synechococcus sp. CS-1329]MCT0219315.1 hypothetical protein [Synechococcus sp. CS-1329]